MSHRLRAHELDLPLRQTTVTDMLAMLDDPAVEIRTIGERVASEPVLAARLLTLANSPFYGRRNEVLDLPTAVMTVGQTSVRALVLALAVDAVLSDDLGLGTDWWDSCLRTGAIAAAVAPHLRADAGTAFCAGLLADIGHLAIAVSAPEAWAELRATSADPVHTTEPHASLAEEVERFGIAHPALGARILADLGLPEPMTHAVATHHDSTARDAGNLNHAVSVAAELVAIERSEEPVTSALESAGLAGINEEELFEQVDTQVGTLRAAFAT